ncbi:MAG TPA: hypothetical protein VHL77_09550 [Ferruginibacter sp.]|jgi:hypothetical protein|nr:hypothetical protein [Ferruginibacter sp.]
MKRIKLSLIFIGFCHICMAQTQPKVINKGDQNTQISTTSMDNVPASQRNKPVVSKYRPDDPGADKPDVLLDIPNLSLDTLVIEVDNLKANLSLDAKVASLVSLKAGVDVGIDRVSIRLKGVQATALLVVRLDNVRQIVDRTLTSLDNNPQLVDRLLQTVDNTVQTVGNVANTALMPGGVISQTVNALGQTVQSTLDATGNIVEKTLDNTGKVLNTRTVGKLLDLPVIKETTNAAGQIVKQVKDNTGQVIEVVVDNTGKIIKTTKIGSGSATGTGSR